MTHLRPSPSPTGAAVLFALLACAPIPALASDCMPCIALKPGQMLSGQFVHTHPVEGFDKPLQTQGRFTVNPESKITWTIEKPMLTTTTITQDGLTQSVGNFQLLKINAQQVPLLATLQQKLLWAISGNWTKLEPDYHIKRRGTKAAWEVIIVPKNEQDTRKAFRQIIAKGGAFVDQADVVLPNGTIDHVAFSATQITP